MKLDKILLAVVVSMFVFVLPAMATPVPSRTPTKTPVVTPTTPPTATPTTPPPPPTNTPTPRPPSPTNTPTPKVTQSATATATVSATPSSCDYSASGDDEVAAYAVPALMAAAPVSKDGSATAGKPPRSEKNKKYDACMTSCKSKYSGKNLTGCTDACADFMCNKDSCQNSKVGDANGNYINNCKDRCNKADYKVGQREACIAGCDVVCK